METSTETEQPSEKISLLKTYFSQFETEQLTLKAKLLEFENLASEKEIRIVKLQAQVDFERRRRQDAEKNVQKLRQLILEQNKTVTQLLTDINAKSVPATNPCQTVDIDDALLLNKVLKSVQTKFDELVMERFQFQLEVEQVTNKVFEALKTIYHYKENPENFSAKSYVSSEIACQLFRSDFTSKIFMQPSKSSEPIDKTAEQSYLNNTDSKSSQSEPEPGKNKGYEIKETQTEGYKFYCACTKFFESHASLSEHIKHCSKLRSETLPLTEVMSTIKLDLSLTGFMKDLVACLPCGKVFISESHMIQHKVKKHGFNETNWTQTDVVSNLPKADGMEDSIILSNDIKPRLSQLVKKNSSKYSGKRFAGSTVLKAHFNYSHGIDSEKSPRQWRCRACKTSYKNLSKLLAHQKDCNSFKNSALEVKRRSKSNRLESKWLSVPPGPVTNSHVFAKAKANQYFCSCGTVVKNRQLLIGHIRRKRLGSIFKCTVCSASFTRYPGLKDHMKKTHELFTVSETFGCKECGKTFDALDEIHSHRKEFHR